MGKVKSTIITVIVTLIVLVLLLFSVISCTLPGGVERYNSILSCIHLGSDFTGDAYTTVMPDGVITAEQYTLSTPEDADKLAEYQAEYVQAGSFYVEKEALAAYTASGKAETDAEIEEGLTLLKADVADDAEVLSKRFGAMGYTSYSVTVTDEVAINVTVPSNFTYAAYNDNDGDAYSDDLTIASTSISYLTLGGELTLRNTDSTISGRPDENYGSTGSLLSVRADVSDYFKSISAYSSGGNYAVKIKLTSTGADVLYDVSQKVANSDDTYIRFYVGTQNVINLTCESVIEDKTFYIQVDDYQTAKNYAALLNSVANGNALNLEYSYSEIKASTSVSGNMTAVLTGIAVLVILLGIMAYSICRYKKLGAVLSLAVVAFALVLIVALFFLETQLTLSGLMVALLCLSVFVGCNYVSFESIKKEISVGRTVQNAVKTGYKKTVAGILDLHIVMVAAGILLAAIGSGEAAACGVILIICSFASYFLHWLTRFMWYVTMSPVKGDNAKRKFFGVKGKSFEEMEEEYEREELAKKSGGEA